MWNRLKKISKDALDVNDPDAYEIVTNLNEHYAKLEIFTSVNLTQRIKDRTDGYNIAYRLAATDLFVERAADYLKSRAFGYKFWGLIAYAVGIALVVWGICSSSKGHDNAVNMTAAQLAPEIMKQFAGVAPAVAQNASAVQPMLAVSEKGYFWFSVSHLVASFTFYGFLMIGAVATWRFGKAMLDQSERLYEKRHAMRQGRLIVHLKDGELSADDLVKAFSWNSTQPNAFGDMATEGKAPVGELADKILRAMPEIIRASKENKT